MGKDELPDGVRLALESVKMPSGRDVLADVIARHVADLVLPVTSPPGVVDDGAVAQHRRLLEQTFARVRAILAAHDDEWCAQAASDARAVHFLGVDLLRVAATDSQIADVVLDAAA